MPVCPKCHQLISESHYERHLRRCGIEHELRSQTSDPEGQHRSIEDAPPVGEQEGGRNWKKWLLAGFVIALLIGSLVVFLLLYVISML